MQSIDQVMKKAALLLTLSFFIFAGCKKGSSNVPTNPDDNGGYASDASKIELYSNDAISLADAAGNFYNAVYMRTTDTLNAFGSCATVATDTIDGVHRLIIRFGSTDCVCLDGRARRGTIIVSYTGRYTDTATVHTITFQDYYINDEQFAGTIKATRVDTTVIGNWYYQVLANDSLITTPNQIITWSGVLTRKWLAGYATGTRGDDVFSISGSAVLTRANGHVFTFNIQTPLQFALDCNYCEWGVVNVTGYTGSSQLDYSPSSGTTVGGCDNVAKLTMDTHIYSINL